MSDARGAYDGIRIVDASQGIAGPYCAMLFAQHGADIIKIEPPGGDWTRGLGFKSSDHTITEICANRGKRSIVIDLRKANSKDVLRRLLRGADIFLESSRPGVADRLGIGFKALREFRSDLIYASFSGYGQNGPYAKLPMTDTVAQAFSGMMHLGVDTKGKPQKIGHYIVDLVASLYGFQAISAAMFSRQRGLGGCFLDINLMQAAASLQAAKIAEFAFHKGPSAVINAPAGTYRTADGWIAVTLTKDEQFFRLCSAIDRNDLRNNDRFLTFALRADHIQELQSQLSSIFAVRPSAFWLEKLQEADVMVTSVLDHRQWLDDLHVRATNAAQIVTQPGFGDLPVPAIPGVMPLGQGDRRGVAPDMGGNSAEILYELGYSRAEVQHLIDADVIAIRTG